MDIVILPYALKSGLRNLKPRYQNQNRWKEGSLVEKVAVRNLVMGEVKILKRGEIYRPDEKHLLESSEDNKKKLASEHTYDATKQVRIQDFKCVNVRFSGSTFTYSPPPSLVPLPLTLLKKPGSMLKT